MRMRVRQTDRQMRHKESKSVSPFVCLTLFLFLNLCLTFLSPHLSVCLTLSPPVCFSLYFCLSVCLTPFLSPHLSVCLTLFLSSHSCLSHSISVSPPLNLPHSISVSLSVSLSLPLSLPNSHLSSHLSLSCFISVSPSVSHFLHLSKPVSQCFCLSSACLTLFIFIFLDLCVCLTFSVHLSLSIHLAVFLFESFFSCTHSHSLYLPLFSFVLCIFCVAFSRLFPLFSVYHFFPVKSFSLSFFPSPLSDLSIIPVVAMLRVTRVPALSRLRTDSSTLLPV